MVTPKVPYASMIDDSCPVRGRDGSLLAGTGLWIGRDRSLRHRGSCARGRRTAQDDTFPMPLWDERDVDGILAGLFAGEDTEGALGLFEGESMGVHAVEGVLP